MRASLFLLAALLLCAQGVLADEAGPYPTEPDRTPAPEFDFIGYYLIRAERTNVSPENTLFAGQVVGRLFGENTTQTSDSTASFFEQRFMPMITYTPHVLNGWAKMRMSFEIDWTWGDKNYTTGGNVGGAYAADAVNIQTQNVFAEIRPQQNLIINAGLLRLYDNVRVPYYTGTNELTYKGYRLAFFGSDATGVGVHYSPYSYLHFKVGGYQLYENNTEQDDDVQLYEVASEYDLDIVNTVGLSLYYLRDHANGEGGIVGYGEGLNSALAGYNGVFRFNFINEAYKADVFWLGTNFFGDPFHQQQRLGYNGFVMLNTGTVSTPSRDVNIMGLAGNLRLGYQYGRTANDEISLDAIYTSGDEDGIEDDTYNGVLTGNNWTSPGAVFFSHGLYLLMAHGTVVNRFTGAVIDIQNMGYGLSVASLGASYDIVPNKLRLRLGSGIGFANAAPTYTYIDDANVPHTWEGGKMMGTELNLNLRWSMKVYLDLELHAAYLALGDFYETPATNGWDDDDPIALAGERPDNPWTVFTTLRWIMF